MSMQLPVKSRINWRQAAGEGLILLAGVLLALGGQAWWEARAEQQLVRGHVANLLVELGSNASGLKDIIRWHETKMEQGADMIRLMEGQGKDDSVLPLLSELAVFADFRPATAALDNLLGAGGLGLFEDTGLQLAVSNYGRAIDRHKEIQNELVEFQLNYFIVFLRDQVPLMWTAYANRMPEPRPAGRFEFDPSALTDSFKFENLLLSRIRAESDAAKFAQQLLTSIEELKPLLGEML